MPSSHSTHRPPTFIASLALAASCAVAQIDPSGIDFVTITALGNAPWPGNGTEGDRAIGRGTVNYEYRIGRFEVTTAQWVEFFNAAYDRADAPLPHLLPPGFWGATPTTPNTPGGRRWTVPAGNDMRPVGDISWRMAAMYCNWLHNDKNTDRSAFMNGAYDVSTFSYADIGFNDQLTRHPDARYWIPTWDEWLKAAHYDPVAAQWRVFPNGTDTPLVYGPPGVLVNGQPTQANAGWISAEYPGHSPFAVPLGAYANVQSPWGLFDVAGGTREWTEDTLYVSGIWPAFRRFDGSAWGASAPSLTDQIHNAGGDFPSLSTFDLGFRIASSVPSPGFSALGIGLLVAWSRRQRREASPRSRCAPSHGNRSRHAALRAT
jgi:sulfatase modifying factor 1